LQLDPAVRALALATALVEIQLAARALQRGAERASAAQLPVQVAEERAGGVDQHRVGHGEHIGDAGPGEPGGDAAQGVVAAELGRLAGREDRERDLLLVQQIPEQGGRDQVLAAVLLLEEQIALVGGARVLARAGKGGAQPLGEGAGGPLAQVPVRVIDAVTVEMQDIDGRGRLVLQPFEQPGQGRRAQELHRHPARGLGLERRHHRLRIGPGVDEGGARRAADDEQQVQPVLGRDRHRGRRTLAREAPAHPDARLGEEEPGPLGVAQQFPGLGQDGRVTAVDGEQAPGLGLGRKAGIETGGGVALTEDGIEEAAAPALEPPGDHRGAAVVELGGVVGRVDLQVPVEFVLVGLGDGAREGQRRGALGPARAHQLDDHMPRVREIQAQFDGHAGSSARSSLGAGPRAGGQRPSNPRCRGFASLGVDEGAIRTDVVTDEIPGTLSLSLSLSLSNNPTTITTTTTMPGPCARMGRAQRCPSSGAAAITPAHRAAWASPRTASLQYPGQHADRKVAGPHSGPYGRSLVGSAVRTERRRADARRAIRHCAKGMG